MRFLVAFAALLVGCSAPPGPLTPADPIDAGPSFVSGAVPTTGLWLTTDFSKPGAPRVQVWGQQLGATYGYAFHVSAKGGVLSDAVVESALGADATTVTGGNEADRSFGAVRRGPSAGSRVIDAATPLASFTLTGGPGDAQVVIDRVQVRRLDGGLVRVQVVGGTLTFPGASR